MEYADWRAHAWNVAKRYLTSVIVSSLGECNYAIGIRPKWNG